MALHAPTPQFRPPDPPENNLTPSPSQPSKHLPQHHLTDPIIDDSRVEGTVQIASPSPPPAILQSEQNQDKLIVGIDSTAPVTPTPKITEHFINPIVSIDTPENSAISPLPATITSGQNLENPNLQKPSSPSKTPIHVNPEHFIQPILKTTGEPHSRGTTAPVLKPPQTERQNNHQTYQDDFPPLTSNFKPPIRFHQGSKTEVGITSPPVRHIVSKTPQQAFLSVEQLNDKFHKNHQNAKHVGNPSPIALDAVANENVNRMPSNLDRQWHPTCITPAAFNANPKKVMQIEPTNQPTQIPNIRAPLPPNVLPSYATRLRATRTFEDPQVDIIDPLFTTKQGLPVVLFDRNDFMVKLASKCRHTLIGKFYTTMPKMDVIRKSLTSQLQIKGSCKVTHFNSTHVYIDLDNEIDHAIVWNKERIYIDGRLMRLLVWTPTFTPEEETPITPVWVVLPQLPWHCYTMKFVSKLLEPVGRVLFFDAASIQRTRGSVAKVKIEIDITKPRPPHIWLGFPREVGDIYGEGRWQELQFEHIPDYCNHCKHQGHCQSQCRVKLREEEYQKRKKDQEDRQREQQGQNINGNTNTVHQSKYLEQVPNQPIQTSVTDKGQCSQALNDQSQDPKQSSSWQIQRKKNFKGTKNQQQVAHHSHQPLHQQPVAQQQPAQQSETQQQRKNQNQKLGTHVTATTIVENLKQQPENVSGIEHEPVVTVPLAANLGVANVTNVASGKAIAKVEVITVPTVVPHNTLPPDITGKKQFPVRLQTSGKSATWNDSDGDHIDSAAVSGVPASAGEIKCSLLGTNETVHAKLGLTDAVNTPYSGSLNNGDPGDVAESTKILRSFVTSPVHDKATTGLPPVEELQLLPSRVPNDKSTAPADTATGNNFNAKSVAHSPTTSSHPDTISDKVQNAEVQASSPPTSSPPPDTATGRNKKKKKQRKKAELTTDVVDAIPHAVETTKNWFNRSFGKIGVATKWDEDHSKIECTQNKEPLSIHDKLKQYAGYEHEPDVFFLGDMFNECLEGNALTPTQQLEFMCIEASKVIKVGQSNWNLNAQPFTPNAIPPQGIVVATEKVEPNDVATESAPLQPKRVQPSRSSRSKPYRGKG